jgi:hypothetical protein
MTQVSLPTFSDHPLNSLISISLLIKNSLNSDSEFIIRYHQRRDFQYCDASS